MNNRTKALVNEILGTSAITSLLATDTLITGSPKAVHAGQIPKGHEAFLPAIVVQCINGGIQSRVMNSPEYYVSVVTKKQSDALLIAEQVRVIFDRMVITEGTKKYSCTCELGNVVFYEDIYTFNCLVKPKQQKGE